MNAERQKNCLAIESAFRYARCRIPLSSFFLAYSASGGVTSVPTNKDMQARDDGPRSCRVLRCVLHFLVVVAISEESRPT